jgi:hypothetical protein
MGGPGAIVEADETFYGKDKNAPHSRTPIRNMNKIVSRVDRSTGRATSFVVTENLSAETVSHILYTNVDRASTLQTDEANHYKRPGKEFAFTTASTTAPVSTSARTTTPFTPTRSKAFSAFSNAA